MWNSLHNRLLLTTMLVLTPMLLVGGWLVNNTVIDSMESEVADRLQSHIVNLLRVAEMQDGQLQLPEYLQEQDFNNSASGLIAMVNDQQGSEVWRSASAHRIDIRYDRSIQLGQRRFGYTIIDLQPFFFANYGIEWENDDGELLTYNFTVLQNRRDFLAHSQRLRHSVRNGLLMLGLCLMLMQQAILHWGLRPLRRLAQEVQTVESGQQEQLHGQYPRELSGVTININLLLASLQRQNERYQNRMADLAHSLKTPLSVLQGMQRELQQIAPQLQPPVAEQLERIDQLVSYQLQRRVKAEQYQWRQGQPVAELLAKMLRSLDKVYRDKQLLVATDFADDAFFYGDERDFYEVAGNLLDNAYKAANRQLLIQANMVTASRQGQPKQLTLCIADDGPGIPEHQHQQVLQRGTRLDSLSPGQGIGLAVVNDIVDSYQGQLHIASSDLGGAQITVRI